MSGMKNNLNITSSFRNWYLTRDEQNTLNFQNIEENEKKEFLEWDPIFKNDSFQDLMIVYNGKFKKSNKNKKSYNIWDKLIKKAKDKYEFSDSSDFDDMFFMNLLLKNNNCKFNDEINRKALVEEFGKKVQNFFHLKKNIQEKLTTFLE